MVGVSQILSKENAGNLHFAFFFTHTFFVVVGGEDIVLQCFFFKNIF